MYRTNLMRKLGMIIALATGLVSMAAQQPPRRPPLSPQKTPANGPAVNLAGITREQFRALPPSALVNYQGQTLTKADFIARKLQEYASHAKAVQQKAALHLKEVQAEYERKHNAELAARNAKVEAEVEKIRQAQRRLAESPEYVALTKEAIDLRTRFGAASPQDKEKIKQRATEVYRQLVQMERLPSNFK